MIQLVYSLPWGVPRERFQTLNPWRDVDVLEITGYDTALKTWMVATFSLRVEWVAGLMTLRVRLLRGPGETRSFLGAPDCSSVGDKPGHLTFA